MFHQTPRKKLQGVFFKNKLKKKSPNAKAS